MKKKRPSTGLPANSPYAAFEAKVRTEAKRWVGIETRLNACAVSDAESSLGIDPFELLDVLNTVRSDAAATLAVGEPCLSDALAFASTEIHAIVSRFDEELRTLCQKHAWSLSGRFPNYTVRGFLLLRVAANERSCEVGTKKLYTLLPHRVLLEVVSAVAEEDTRRRAEPKDFLEALYKAYERCVAIEATGAENPASIRHVFRELVVCLQPDTFWRSPQQSRFVEYTEEYFRRDLARLINSADLVTSNGSRLELLPKAFPKEGVPVAVDGGTRYFGKIKFGGSTE